MQSDESLSRASAGLLERFAAHGAALVDRDDGARVVDHPVAGVVHRFALPLTFTPFASARPCSARCVFCSETLVHRDAARMSAALRPGPGYFAGLARALAELRGLPLGLSLSGLEATDDPAWLCAALDVLTAADLASPFTDKVLYTNAAGLHAGTHAAELVPRLQAFGLTRAEVSRHHHEAARNDGIMRFRPGERISEQAVFEAAVRGLAGRVPVRLVCVVQRTGVSDLAGVLAYLEWAARLGVDDVVLREFSRLHDLYRPNVTLRNIEDGRVAIESLLAELWPADGPCHLDFVPAAVTRGYYYWNVRFRWKDRVDVTFETSDYATMKSRHGEGVVHKLVFHADGNLCGDWDPDRRVLLRTGDPPHT
ncbi:hypothetical protein [Nannocystis punicea]|uniref:Radical SAM core domain-containing protein n=1 Tax=Nannocystis punicea TaxID=2995304 RepID=A0ABY7GW43_9BACT|nr:hypothetical protein [Nannocystis poenicansa]WAS91193.1 hypothetical protein O0S08_33820 [Nannocystis poenicansa]